MGTEQADRGWYRFGYGTRLWMIAACLLSGWHGSTAAGLEGPDVKPRVVVMTDIGGDPDDQQSLVRFLLYSCDVDVEGLCTGFGHGHYRNTRPDLLHAGIEAYAQVLPNLRLHRPDYPSAADLAALVKDGHNGDPHSVGPGMDSEASEWIIRVLDRDDSRPVWFTIWGGPRELAQAVWKVQTTRSPAELDRFKRRIRVHSIADQDRTAVWMKTHHPDVFWIYSDGLFRGIWQAGDQDLVSPTWLETNVRTGHGPLGALYPAKAAGKTGVKEGDTPSFFYVLPDGLSDPGRPEWGNWGGRFRRSGRGEEFIPAHDLVDGRPDMLFTIHRWRRAYQNAFAARMDWCVEPFEGANHAPVAVLNGDRTRSVLEMPVEPGATVRLSGAGSADPDGDALTWRWWTYREAGSYWDHARIEPDDAPEVEVTVPTDAAGRTMHIILEVTDAGEPALTACRRIVLRVRGTPQRAPVGYPLAEEDLTTPVTALPGPPAETGPWRFFRGINVNGPAIVIDGQSWDGDDAAGFECSNRPLNRPEVALLPPTDEARARMIHAFRWDRAPRLALTGVPAGTYAVFVYIWEETSPETLTIRLNDRIVAENVSSGRAGQWRRWGPWETAPQAGELVLTATGGAANFSGIEVWRRER